MLNLNPSSITVKKFVEARISIESNVEPNISQIAYDNNHLQAFQYWLHTEENFQNELAKDRYIFFSICNCFASHYDYLHSINSNDSKRLIQRMLVLLRELELQQKSFSEEWFKGINLIIDALTQRNLIQDARDCTAIALRTGVIKFPGLAQITILHASYLDYIVGRKDKSARTALSLLQQPYLLPSRRELPRIYFQCMHILAANNHIQEYRNVIWRGVSSFYSDTKLKDAFTQQLINTYRGATRAILFSNVSLAFRVSFMISNMSRLAGCVPLLNLIGITRTLDFFHRAWSWSLNLSRLSRIDIKSSKPNKVVIFQASRIFEIIRKPRSKKILVTRAMGGIGDVIMMTPGLLALKRKNPKAQIDFATPKSFHSLLKDLPGINIIDINGSPLPLENYSRWINLTDCPAGRAEHKQYPNVTKNRIESFAKAMRISNFYLWITKGYQPFFKITQEEVKWAQDFLKEINPKSLPLIGIQPFSADSYKNWPYMEELAMSLAKENCVLVFHHEHYSGYSHVNIHQIYRPIRESISLLSQVQNLVAVDSSFVHIAAALKINTVAIFGPTSGKVFVRHYPTINYISPKKSEFPCNPCWRNEHKSCHINNGRESICLRSVSVGNVINKMDFTKDKNYSLKSLFFTIAERIMYGHN